MPSLHYIDTILTSLNWVDSKERRPISKVVNI